MTHFSPINIKGLSEQKSLKALVFLEFHCVWQHLTLYPIHALTIAIFARRIRCSMMRRRIMSSTAPTTMPPFSPTQ